MAEARSRRILVTGGDGFLGSRIADELIRRNHEVVVLDVSPIGSNDRLTIEGDVRDPEAVAEALNGCDAVFHCAAVADLDEAKKDPRKALDINVLGTLCVLEQAARAGVHRFMHASSVYVYARSGSVYRTSKRAAENIIWDLAETLSMKVTLLRFGSIYGPGADKGNAIKRVIDQALREGRIDFWGDGTEVREYIHAADASALAVDALDEQYVGQALHISGQERMTTRQLLEMIQEMIGGGIEIDYQDLPFEGRYRTTPYAFEPMQGLRLTRSMYVDMGVGLLETMQAAQNELQEIGLDS